MQVTQALRGHFKPEFLNRVDDIIIFRPLGEAEIGRIVDLQLRRLDRLLADQKLRLDVTPAARALIAHDGYDPAFGARPLKRAIQRLLQNPLALALLRGEFGEGETVRVDAAGDGLSFTKV
jgi:ATP-dependent Clp protease ATP-binding subunit ClpB